MAALRNRLIRRDGAERPALGREPAVSHGPSLLASGAAAYVVILALGALDTAGYSIIAPVVPAIAEETGEGPAAMGILVSSFAVGMAGGFVLAGRTVQARGASFTLALAMAFTAAGAVGFLVGESYVVYFASRLLMGVGAGGLWIGATFAIFERFPGQEYRRLTGLLAACSVGGIAGPALGAIGGVRAPFAAYLGLTAVAAVALAAVSARHARAVFASDRSALRRPGFWLASAGILLVAIGVGTVDGPLPLHFDERLSQAEIGALYFAASIVLGASAIAAGRLPPRPLLAVGAILIVVGPGLAGTSESVPMWILALGLAGIGFGLGEAGAIGVLLETIGVERILLAMVVWSQIWAVGYLAGPAVGGGVAEAFGFGAVGVVPLAAALVVALAFIRAPRAVPQPVRSPS
ncbi:MAG: MFS transporter [Actinomycetota bacterium]|nr:MFS transporter [Actinomycetota bacterium]